MLEPLGTTIVAASGGRGRDYLGNVKKNNKHQQQNGERNSKNTIGNFFENI